MALTMSPSLSSARLSPAPITSAVSLVLPFVLKRSDLRAGAKPVAQPPPLGFVCLVRIRGDIVGLTTRAAERAPISSTRQPLAADESPCRLERSILTILWRDGTGAQPVAQPPPLGFVCLVRISGDIVGFFTRAAVPEPLSSTRQPFAADESPCFIKGTPPRRCVPLATHENR